MAEAESSALREFVSGRRIASSRVAVVEVTKAAARANPTTDVQATLMKVAFVEMDAELGTLACETGGPELRSLDAIHIASALRLGPEVESFVTYDSRQADAARASGLRVETPM